MAKRAAKPAEPKAPAASPADQGSVQLNRLQVPANLAAGARKPAPMVTPDSQASVCRSIERYWIETIELHRFCRAVLPAEAWKTLITLFDREILEVKKLTKRPARIDVDGVEPDDDTDDGVTLPDSDYKFPVTSPAMPAKKGKAPAPADAKANGHVTNGKPAKGATG